MAMKIYVYFRMITGSIFAWWLYLLVRREGGSYFDIKRKITPYVFFNMVYYGILGFRGHQ